MLRLLQHPVLLVFLCLSLIGTPVTYRGGASNPHPHMFLEFLMEASGGSFDHHHHGEAEEPETAAHESHEHHESHQNPPSTQLADPTERFGASLSVFVVGDVGQLAFIIPEHALPQSSLIQVAVPSESALATGIVHPPIAPPPR